ncbi:hypothetical protein BJX65DRAFT_272992 [Aspergillus insuetus]
MCSNHGSCERAVLIAPIPRLGVQRRSRVVLGVQTGAWSVNTRCLVALAVLLVRGAKCAEILKTNQAPRRPLIQHAAARTLAHQYPHRLLLQYQVRTRYLRVPNPRWHRVFPKMLISGDHFWRRTYWVAMSQTSRR